MGCKLSKTDTEDDIELTDIKKEHRKFPNISLFHNSYLDCYSPHKHDSKAVSVK